MGDLFWNKIAAVIIGLVLMVMVIGIVGEVVFSEEHGGDEHASLAYPIDLDAVLGGTGSSEPVEVEVIDLGTLLASADASSGERTFRRCVSCHNAEPGAGNLQGPNLWGIVGRDIGSYDGFSYSGAMSALDGDWTYEQLDHFIANPRGWLDGTAMAFAGIRNEEDRADLLAYLQTLSDNPVAFPAPVVAETAEVDGTDMLNDAVSETESTVDQAEENVDDQLEALNDAVADGGVEETPVEEGGNR